MVSCQALAVKDTGRQNGKAAGGERVGSGERVRWMRGRVQGTWRLAMPFQATTLLVAGAGA